MNEGFALHKIIYDNHGEVSGFLYLEVNQSFKKILGLSKRKVVGKRIDEVLSQIDSQLFSSLNKVADTGKSIQIESYFQKLDKYFIIDIFKYQKGEIATVLTDISKQKKSKRRAEYISFHDQLTGLYNQNYFEEELERLDTARQLPISIIVGDVNGLKLTNDAFGHQMGNQLLVKVANILKDSCRKEDIIARWGGDEFAILLIKTDKVETEEIIKRIKNYCKENECKPIKPSIALGYATKLKVEENLREVFKKAESMMYKNKLNQSNKVKSWIITCLEQRLFKKNPKSKKRSERIKNLALKFGKSLGLSDSKLKGLALLATFHDIGKVQLEKNILLKSESLTEEEWDQVREHPKIGYHIAKSSPQLAHIAQDILSHHERWDGSGYPQGIKGEEIPFLARIIAIIDAYDALVYGRPYKEKSSIEDALEELKRFADKQFDPNLIAQFVEMIEKDQ